MVKIGPLEFKVESYDAEEWAARQTSLPEPGRCADRIEDFFKVLSGGWNNSLEQHKAAWSTMVECLRSDQGDEPRGSYVLLERGDQFWQDHAARPTKYERLRMLDLQQQAAQLQQQQQLQQAQQQQQQSQQPSRFSWLWWWRRAPQPPLATVKAAAE